MITGKGLCLEVSAIDLLARPVKQSEQFHYPGKLALTAGI